MSGGHVRQRGKSWLLKYDAGKDPVTGKRRQRYATVKGGTKTAANAKLRELMSAVDKGLHVDPRKMTVRQWNETWLLDHAAATVSPKTFERYAELLRGYVAPELGDMQIQKLVSQPAAIQRLYAQLQRSGRKVQKTPSPKGAGLAARTVLHVHRVFSQSLAAAVKMQIIARNPAADVTPPKPAAVRAHDDTGGDGDTVINALDRDRLTALLEGFKGRALFNIVVLAAGTGMRRGELLALRWSDCDFEGRTLHVARAVEFTRQHGCRIKVPKTKGSRRRIGIDPGLVAMLRGMRAQQAEICLKLGRKLPGDALVFPYSPLAPTQLRTPGGVTKDFVKIATATGFPGFRFHDLRHTHATLLLQEGVPINAVSQRLGHSGPTITLTVYGHVLRRAEEQAAQVAGSFTAGALAG